MSFDILIAQIGGIRIRLYYYGLGEINFNWRRAKPRSCDSGNGDGRGIRRQTRYSSAAV